jgi:uncharacterized RDD family membrane protein YckC
MSQFLQEGLIQPDADLALTRGVLVRRFLAFLVDVCIIGALSWAVAAAIFIFGLLTFGAGWLLFHIMPVMPFIYYVLLVGAGRATPGQRLFGLRVVRDLDLQPPTPAQALVWTLLMWVSFVLACVPFALALVGPRHRAAHDLLSGLVVVRDWH